jgi:hypothetical protein
VVVGGGGGGALSNCLGRGLPVGLVEKKATGMFSTRRLRELTSSCSKHPIIIITFYSQELVF